MHTHFQMSNIQMLGNIRLFNLFNSRLHGSPFRIISESHPFNVSRLCKDNPPLSIVLELTIKSLVQSKQALVVVTVLATPLHWSETRHEQSSDGENRGWCSGSCWDGEDVPWMALGSWPTGQWRLPAARPTWIRRLALCTSLHPEWARPNQEHPRVQRKRCHIKRVSKNW